MSKRGGKRPGAGRRKGSQARATKENKGTIGDLARRYDDVALATLGNICENGQSESARVAAANSLLDRGYGRPPQAVQHSGPEGGPIEAEFKFTFLLDNASTDQND